MEDEVTPVVKSTSIGEENDDFTFTNVTFNVNNAIDEVEPIQEASFHDRLTETILEDRGVTYTIIETGSQRQTRVLVSNIGYAYTVKCKSKTTVTWRCTSRSKAVRCPVTVLQKGEHFAQRKEHVHPALPDRELRLRVYSKVRATASSNVFQPARSTAEHILTDERGAEDVARPQTYLLKRAANRARSKFRPKEPDTLDFELDQNFIDADEFLIADLRIDDQRHFVFGTEFQLDLLRQARRWYMDVTFKVVGEPFKRQGQLFTVNTFIERDGQSKQLPLVFVLMSRRTKPDYTAVFRAIIDQVGEVSVAGFVADFEVVREVFPGKEMKGCAFHWSQAIWQRVQEEGLSEVYRRRGGVHRFVRMLMALQFLPPTHIGPAFEQVRQRASTVTSQRLVSYNGRQWVYGSVFQPQDWSVFKQEIRTNNNLEGYHNCLNGKAGACLGFYRLVPHLRNEAEIAKIAVEGGDLRRETTSRSRAVQKALTTLDKV